MRFFRAGKVDRNLGIYHALENRKNLLLMTVSFALSILMFMSFSGIVDFMHHAVRPLRPWSPDLSLVSADNTCSIENKIYEELEKNPEINKVYGRMFAFDVPFSGEQSETQEMSYLSPMRSTSSAGRRTSCRRAALRKCGEHLERCLQSREKAGTGIRGRDWNWS